MSTVTIPSSLEVEQCTEFKAFKWNAENGAMVHALFTWDLTRDGSESPVHLHPDYRGQVTIKWVFTQGTDTVVTLIVYGEFVDIMEIDANKNVTNDLA